MTVKFDCGEWTLSKGKIEFIRMRNAKILCIGVTGLANEVLKNIVLAGIHSIGLIDSQKVVAEDLGSQFLLGQGDIGKMVEF